MPAGVVQPRVTRRIQAEVPLYKLHKLSLRILLSDSLVKAVAVEEGKGNLLRVACAGDEGKHALGNLTALVGHQSVILDLLGDQIDHVFRYDTHRSFYFLDGFGPRWKQLLQGRHEFIKLQFGPIVIAFPQSNHAQTIKR